MACTAAITVSSATAKPEQRVHVTCTVSNGGGASVNVLWLRPYLQPTGTTLESVSAAQGVPPLGPGMTVAVAASGTLAITYDVVAHSPQPGGGLANPSSQVFDVGAVIGISDGSIVTATETTLTVTPPTH